MSQPMKIETPLALIALLLETKTYIEDKENHSEEITKTLVEIGKAVKLYDVELGNIVTELTNQIYTWYVKDRGPMFALYVKDQWDRAFRRLFRLAELSDGWRLEI